MLSRKQLRQLQRLVGDSARFAKIVQATEAEANSAFFRLGELCKVAETFTENPDTIREAFTAIHAIMLTSRVVSDSNTQSIFFLTEMLKDLVSRIETLESIASEPSHKLGEDLTFRRLFPGLRINDLPDDNAGSFQQ